MFERRTRIQLELAKLISQSSHVNFLNFFRELKGMNFFNFFRELKGIFMGEGGGIILYLNPCNINLWHVCRISRWKINTYN